MSKVSKFKLDQEVKTIFDKYDKLIVHQILKHSLILKAYIKDKVELVEITKKYVEVGE